MGAKGERPQQQGVLIVLGALVALLVFRSIVDESVEVPASLTGAIADVHDPTLVKDGDSWYVFSTGWGIPIRRSVDLTRWQVVGSVFPKGLPGWAREQVPGLRADEITAWAPDLSKVDGRWQLYWSIGVLGTSKGVIGHATNATLDPSDPNYKWVDEGPVVSSGRGGPTMAIDPAAVTDENGGRWLAWGSFGQGIMLQQLDPKTGRFLAGSTAVNIARRDPFFLGIEGANLVHEDGWWWLYVSFGFCCRGLNSQYSIHVGRSRAITGPYLDAAGAPMMANGGTTLTGSYGNVVGPGHGSVVDNGDEMILVNHFYDRAHEGRPTMMLRPVLMGPDGWPYSPDPGFDADRIDRSDGVGHWRIGGYPEEAPTRPPETVLVDLHADGTVVPTGTWRVEDGIVQIEGVTTPAGVRNFWLAVDSTTHAAFGRDNRTAAVRAQRSDPG